MQRVNLIDMFQTPDFYKPPADEQLATNTQYPNLNSREFQTRPPAETSRSRKYFEHLAVNGVGNAVLVANRYTDRVWHGHFWGFERLTDVHGGVLDALGVGDGGDNKSDGAAYRLRCNATVTAFRYAQDDMLLLGDTAGTLALWSTHSRVRAPSGGYCLFKVGQQSEHTGAINALDIFAAQRTNALTGGADGCVKCWDMGDGDLFSTQTYRAAHSRPITAVATSPAEADIFATCSLDRSLQLWDRRLARPIVAVNERCAVGLTALQWSRGSGDAAAAEAGGRLYVGDEAGEVHCVDLRQMGSFERTWRPFGRGEGGRVHRLRFDGHERLLAVVADSAVVKVLDVQQVAKDDDVATGAAVVFTTPHASDLVRDVHWGADADGELYTIGWGAALAKHQVVTMNGNNDE